LGVPFPIGCATRPIRRSLIRRLLSLLLFILIAAPGAAAPPPSPAAAKTLIVATRPAPPFVIREPDGHWSGLAIELWRGMAGDLGLRYRFREASLQDMVAGVADGRFGMSVGALTVTPDREARIDFTHPFYTTGFGIVTDRAAPTWLVLLRNFFTWGFLQAVLLLAAVLLVVGFLLWLAERRHNEEQFGGGPVRGTGSGFWISAVTMTTVGYGDKAPRTFAGRLIAVVWMFAAVIIISTFTGMIASSLTESRLGGIRGVDDLQNARVGSIRGSAAQQWLDLNTIGFTSYPSIEAGLDAVAAHRIDAFVYDRPLLGYVVRTRYNGRLRLLPGSFGRQDYAFALPQGSALREPINEALLRHIDRPQWSDMVKRTLGKGE